MGPSTRVTGQTSFLRFLVVFKVAVLFLVLSLPAWAADEGLPGPTWAWIGALCLNAMFTVGSGLAVALAREALSSQRAAVQSLTDRLNDTREHYVTHKQFGAQLDAVVNPLKKDIEALEKKVDLLSTSLGTIADQNGQILRLLTPPPPSHSVRTGR